MFSGRRSAAGLRVLCDSQVLLPSYVGLVPRPTPRPCRRALMPLAQHTTRPPSDPWPPRCRRARGTVSPAAFVMGHEGADAVFRARGWRAVCQRSVAACALVATFTSLGRFCIACWERQRRPSSCVSQPSQPLGVETHPLGCAPWRKEQRARGGGGDHCVGVCVQERESQVVGQQV